MALLNRCRDQIILTEEVVRAAAGNFLRGNAIMTLLFDRHEYQIVITEEAHKVAEQFDHLQANMR